MLMHNTTTSTTLFVTGRGVMPSDGAVRLSDPEQVRGFWGDMARLTQHCELHKHIHLTLNFVLPPEAFPQRCLVRMHGSLCGAGEECVVPRTNTGRDCEKAMAQLTALLPRRKRITDIDAVVFIGVGLTMINGVGVQALLREVMNSLTPPHVTIVDTRKKISLKSAKWLRECSINTYSLKTTSANTYIQELAGEDPAAGADIALPDAQALYKAFKWFQQDVPSELAALTVWANMARENLKDIVNAGVFDADNINEQKMGTRKRARYLT
jgi:hypothetical protein